MNAKISFTNKILIGLILVAIVLALYPVMNVWAQEAIWDNPGGAPPQGTVSVLYTTGDIQQAATLDVLPPSGGMVLYCFGHRYVAPATWSLFLCPKEPPDEP